MDTPDWYYDYQRDERSIILELSKLHNSEVDKRLDDIEHCVTMFGDCFNNWLNLYAIVYNLEPLNWVLLRKFQEFLYNYALYKIKGIGFK